MDTLTLLLYFTRILYLVRKDIVRKGFVRICVPISFCFLADFSSCRALRGLHSEMEIILMESGISTDANFDAHVVEPLDEMRGGDHYGQQGDEEDIRYISS